MSPSSPTSPCLVPRLDQLTDLALWEAELAADPIVVESGLMRRLATVPDQRSACGRRHPLVVILTLIACATLVVGGDSVAAIWQWAARTSQAVLARLGAYRDPFTGRFTVPSERTFRRILAGLDADALDTAISGYVADVMRQAAPVPQIPDTPGPIEREQRRTTRRQITHPAPDGLLPGAALDGKASRGARTAGGGRIFLVGAISHENGVVLLRRLQHLIKPKERHIANQRRGTASSAAYFTRRAGRGNGVIVRSAPRPGPTQQRARSHRSTASSGDRDGLGALILSGRTST